MGSSLLHYTFTEGRRTLHHHRSDWNRLGVRQTHTIWKRKENIHDRRSFTGTKFSSNICYNFGRIFLNLVPII